MDPQLAKAWVEAEQQPPAWPPPAQWALAALLLALRRGAVAGLLRQPWERASEVQGRVSEQEQAQAQGQAQKQEEQQQEGQQEQGPLVRKRPD